ncbi:MAG: hydroxymethylbilane synthase [Verrucomicrobiota bacterium]
MSSDKPIYIATRGSALALVQANFILGECQRHFPKIPFALKIIKTTGDKMQTASLSRIDATLPRGLFTKEIEEALLNGEADLAVHSLKDLPTTLPESLKLGATPPRADARDVLICHNSKLKTQNSKFSLSTLPQGATIATSSTRRAAQLLEKRPDLKIVPIRGNVGTRLQKLADSTELTGTILAAAGLDRLGYKISANGELENSEFPVPGSALLATHLSLDEMLPCVGQAALGIETRENDPHIDSICEKLNHNDTWNCVVAERAFLRAMGGGCQSAVGAFAEIIGGQLRLHAVSYLGENAKRGNLLGEIEHAQRIGEELANSLKPT